MVNKKETLGFTDKEAFEFMFEKTVLYWLDMLPLEHSKKMIEVSKRIKFNWYYALNVQFTGDENPDWETISPTMIKYFLIEFIEETKWKPKMDFNLQTFEKMFKKIKNLKKRDEKYFITKCFI